MGLIKSAFTSITSTLHDQWNEYISCNDLNTDILVSKKLIKNGLSKIRIQVLEGQLILICDFGKIKDVAYEAGIYSYDITSSSSLTFSSEKNEFKEMWSKIKNYEIPNEQSVIYININEIINNKFGVSTPILYPDSKYGNIFLRYYGTYTLKISNPFEFFISIAPNLKNIYTKTELINQINSIFLKIIASSLQICAKEGIPYTELSNNGNLIAKYMNEILNKETSINLKGLEIIDISLENIVPTRESLMQIDKNINELNSNIQEKFIEVEPIKNKKRLQMCPNCGAKVNGRFCSECGMQIAE